MQRFTKFKTKSKKTRTETGTSRGRVCNYRSQSERTSNLHGIQLSQQQLNFNFDTAASLLLTLYADIKSCRAALYSFRINVINATPTLLDKRLPISLVPRKSLIKILDSVHDSQKNAPDRLTMAIPMTDILSYYDAKLVQEISTVEDGLLLTLAIPLASSQTVFGVYRAIVIPKPQKDSVDAL